MTRHNNIKMTPNLIDKNADELLAHEMAALSMQERERAYFDVHGIPDNVVKETPELVAICLADLDEELNKIERKQAYDTAKLQDPDYVSNRKLLLKFLRSESFDSRRAAERLVAFCQLKLDIFGESKITKDIRIADLNEEDTQVLESGLIQLLPRRDRAGRAIQAICAPLGPYEASTESKVRQFTKNEGMAMVRKYSHFCSLLSLSDASIILHNDGGFGR
jgi:hypothetical protein